MKDTPEQDNGHGKKPALIDNKTRHARLPHPNPPPEGEGANESLREFQSDDLFRQLLDDVTPLKPSDRRIPSPAPRKPRPQSRLPETIVADTFSDHGAGDVAPAEYLGNGLNRMTLRKLRRSEWPVQDELDLHGLNSDEARRLLTAFLHQATQDELRCVQVIHGKGWHSEQGEGLLKRLARHWLIQHPLVLAFCDAPMNAGGGGAVRVLLKTAGRESGSDSFPPA